jgi:hypothetical protein
MRSLIEVCGKQIRIEGRLLRTARLEADGYLFLEDPEPVVDGLRRCGTRIDLFTFMQRLPENSPKHNYPVEWDNFAALPVSTFQNWWTRQISSKTRNMVRKAEKMGVVVRELPFDDDLVKGFWRVYNESPVRQGLPNKHYGKDIETVYRDEATFLDNSIFIGAFLGEEPIGFVKLVHDDTRTQAGMMNIVAMIRHRDKAPTNALIAQAVRSCAERRISYLVYSRFAYSKKQSSSLSEFKEHNGFQRIDLPRYYVPLTRNGRMAQRLALHRGFGFVDYLPAPIVAKLRDVRAAWYNRKLASIKGSL